jgi:hypothetical protein
MAAPNSPVAGLKASDAKAKLRSSKICAAPRLPLTLQLNDPADDHESGGLHNA